MEPAPFCGRWQGCSFFQIDGYEIASRWYGDPESAAAAIVFAHGFCGTQDVVAPALACSLMARGACVVLTFDYSGFGRSGGPRHRLDPVRQQRDCQAAVEWVRSRVPTQRLGIFGLSLGASVAAAVATMAPVDFVVGLNAVADGEGWLRELRTEEQARAFDEALRHDAEQRLTSGTSVEVPSPFVVPRRSDGDAFHAALRRAAPDRDTTLDLASAQLIREWCPLPRLRRHDWSRCQTWFVHAERDEMASPQHSRALAMATSGTFEMLEECGHYEVYEPPTVDAVLDRVHELALAPAIDPPKEHVR